MLEFLKKNKGVSNKYDLISTNPDNTETKVIVLRNNTDLPLQLEAIVDPTTQKPIVYFTGRLTLRESDKIVQLDASTKTYTIILYIRYNKDGVEKEINIERSNQNDVDESIENFNSLKRQISNNDSTTYITLHTRQAESKEITLIESNISIKENAMKAEDMHTIQTKYGHPLTSVKEVTLDTYGTGHSGIGIIFSRLGITLETGKKQFIVYIDYLPTADFTYLQEQAIEKYSILKSIKYRDKLLYLNAHTDEECQRNSVTLNSELRALPRRGSPTSGNTITLSLIKPNADFIKYVEDSKLDTAARRYYINASTAGVSGITKERARNFIIDRFGPVGGLTNRRKSIKRQKSIKKRRATHKRKRNKKTTRKKRTLKKYNKTQFRRFNKHNNLTSKMKGGS